MARLVAVLPAIMAILTMIVIPPLMGMLAFVLWLLIPLPIDMTIPAILAGLWTAIVIAAIIRRSFE